MAKQRQQQQAIENSFVKGTLTEYGPLTFPENAVTESQNCIFDRTGKVFRRKGIDLEEGFQFLDTNHANSAVSNYFWQDSSADTSFSIEVVQYGPTLYFFRVENVNEALSSRLISTVDLNQFLPSNAITTQGPFDQAECQYAQGYGFLFVFNPYLNPFYCSFDPIGGINTGVGNTIEPMIRDFAGLNDGLADADFPGALTNEHQYNLQNQGWRHSGDTGPLDPNDINTFQTATGKYPSNTAIWWRYKNASGVFDPATTKNNISSITPAPKGHYISRAFHFDFSAVSNIGGFTALDTAGVRPSTGAFHAGRVWYAGVNQAGYASNIYFSQVIENNNTAQFAKCYQVNDPTSEELFDLLPTDGGVITIPGMGRVHKLVSIQEGLLVFGSLGVWIITGSVGTGFTANDYTVQKLDTIPTISHSSFVIVNDRPLWWNGEGIYTIANTSQDSSPQDLPQRKGMGVQSLTNSTIATFYLDIPKTSLRFARGAFNKPEFIVQWVYNTREPTTNADRYKFNGVLNYNILTGAFYAWTINDFDTSSTISSVSFPPSVYINGITVVQNPGDVGDVNYVPPKFKYLTTNAGFELNSFAEERDINYVDWATVVNNIGGVDYSSYIVNGYRTYSAFANKFAVTYLNMYNLLPPEETLDVGYVFKTAWDFSLSGDSGRRTTSTEFVNLSNAINPVLAANFSAIRKRHKVRGQGYVLQYRVESIPGHPFYLLGWGVWDTRAGGP